MNDSTLPGCVGYFGKPRGPNGPCETCQYRELCRRVIAKERIKFFILKIDAILQGERQ